MKTGRRTLTALLFLLSVISLKSYAAEVVTVINPEGAVESVEQLQVSFSEPMIELGVGSELVPVESDCLVNGNGYWTDEKTWVYTFKQPPAPNRTCVFKTLTSVKSLNNNSLKAKTSEFKTLQAQIVASLPGRYDSIDAKQYFVLKLNGAPDVEWIKKNAFFSVKGLGEKIPLVFVSEGERKEILENIKTSDSYWYTENKISDSLSDVIVIKSERTFPRGQNVELHWLKDFTYSVSQAFKATFNCERESAASACVPLSNMSLSFSGDVPAKNIKNIFIVDVSGTKIYASESKKINSQDKFNNLTFPGPFAAKKKYKLEVNGIRSTDGEKLTNAGAFPLSIATADLPSLLKIDRTFSVLEASNPVLPVTIRNIENPVPTAVYTKSFPLKGSKVVLTARNASQIIDLIKRVEKASPEKPLENAMSLAPFEYQLKKTLSPEATEVVGIPLEGKGLHFHEFKSRILGNKLNYKADNNPDYYVRSLALVTNISLTLKYSQKDILVWATTLDKGEPLKNVPVFLYSNAGVRIKELKTGLDGVAYSELTAAESTALLAKEGYYSRGFYVFAQKDDDFSYVNSKDNQGFEKYRFGINLPYVDPEFIFHAVLEKNLLRPKEILKAKLIYRKLETVGLSIPKMDLPKQIQIKNQITHKKFMVKAKWDKANGTGLIEWKIPDGATLGSYAISYPDPAEDNEETSQFSRDEEASDVVYNDKVFGHFSVEEFKTPSITAQMTAIGTPWINEKSPKVEFSAKYFNGGPAAAMPVKIRYSLESDSVFVSGDDFSDYIWQSGRIKEGITKRDSAPVANNQPKLNQLDLKSDSYGQLQFALTDFKYSNEPQRAVVSAEYKDANGDIQTLTRSYSLFSSRALIGLKAKSWYQSVDAFDFEAALVDLKNNPLIDKTITLTAYRIDNFSTRKKLLGGFYSYESFEEVKKERELCSGKTNEKGKLSCHTADKSLNGEYVVVASYKDETGVTISSKISSFVAGEYWFGGSDSDRMDLIPFKKSYEPGETAEFQVRGPISEGRLLVTIERGKVLSQFVQDFKTTNPTIKFKIENTWAPNIVVSAILIRGRVDGKITGQLDLGKPSLKMGMTSLLVGIKKHILNVKVTTNKEIFQPRENIEATIHVTDDKNNPVNAELAVAAVDEALLSLRANDTWNLIGHLLPLRAHTIETAYMMSNVLGKRTLGLKAVPTGGDGAGAASRELFDTSLFWNPKVVVKNGLAKVTFKANDSLTAFKVVAIALAGAEQFGTGDGQIKITKDIQSFSSLALAVRKKDSYFANFNVRNTTKDVVNLKALLTLNKNNLSEKEFSLKPNETTELSWPVLAPNSGFQEFELKVTNGTKIVDLLKVKQEVQDVWPMRSFGSSFKQEQSISVPVGMTPDATKSVVQVVAMPSLNAELPGMKKFWDLYPYDCFEQRLSKSISLSSPQLFADLMKIADLYTDGTGLIKFYPQTRYGSVFLTNYALQIIHAKGWEANDGLKQRSIEALKKVFDGRLEILEYYDKNYKELVRLETLDTLTMYGESKPTQFAELKFGPMEMLPNNYLAHVVSILKNDKDIPNQPTLLKQALQILRSRTVLTSGRLSFKENAAGNFSSFYVTEDASQAKVLIQVLARPEFKIDGGRLILSFLDQAKAGYWYNTMADAWAIVALDTYKNEFEKTKVKGEISWGLEGEEHKKVLIAAKNVEDTFVLKNSTKVEGTFTGAGKPWWNVLVFSDAPVLKDRMHGISIEKTWKAIEEKKQGQKNVGDIWQVTLKVSSKSAFQWLAIRDPLPPGAMVIDEDGATFSEKKALEYRAYENWFEGTEKTYVYRIRLNQAGTFNLPTTRAEAMYDTDNYGEKVNGETTIQP